MTTVHIANPEVPARPPLLTPRDVARVLVCSEWWVKEQARRRRIPFTRVGGAYRFTPEHLREIINIFEERPGDQVPAVNPVHVRRQAHSPSTGSVVQLRSRPPRRNRNAG